MTLLEINLTDVLSETDPDDRVIVWAPVMREGPAGQLVGPRRKSIPLTDGVGSDEVVPGPLMVQVQCKAMSDTRPREVVVPEVGPVTLTDLLHETFTYTPDVVNASLTQITTARDAALADVDGAVDQALAGSQRYSGTGFPNGVVAAPVGSIYTDTAATNGAIRWIKTSGTGNTGWVVEYGNTGWRNMSSALSGILESGSVFFRRRGDTVDIVTEWAKLIPAVTAQMPAGFRPFRGDTVPLYPSSSSTTPVAQFRIAYTGNLTVYVFDDRYSANDQGTLTTSDPWPTTLPGVPA